MPSVLFICTANICRSPMAMGLLRVKVGSSTDWRIESAGTWSLEGQPAAANTLFVLEKRGIDLRGHRSRGVSRELLEQFNLILTMEAGHKEALRVEFPAIADRVYMISEMIDREYDIADPIGGSLEGFDETAQEFDRIFDLGYPRISHLAQD